MLQAAKVEGQGHLRPLELKSQISGMKLQDLVFSLVGFSLALVQCFLTMSLFLSFGMVMPIQCHCILKYIICFLGFFFFSNRRLQLRDYFEFEKRLWTFKL